MRADDENYGQYNRDGSPKSALRRVLSEMSGQRSVNDIAYDILQAAPQVEPLVEEWFAALSAAYESRREFFCRFCLQPAPDDWGAGTRCPKHPKKGSGMPGYMQSCEYAIGGGPLREGVSMPTAIIGNVPPSTQEEEG